MGKQMSGNFAVYRGHCLELRSWNDEGQILLATSDSTLASALGFSSKVDGPYRAWIPRVEVEEVFWKVVYGEVKGIKVLLESDEGSEYFIRSQTGFDGFIRIDKALWEGRLDKSAVSRSWTEKGPLFLR